MPYTPQRWIFETAVTIQEIIRSRDWGWLQSNTEILLLNLSDVEVLHIPAQQLLLELDCLDPTHTTQQAFLQVFDVAYEPGPPLVPTVGPPVMAPHPPHMLHGRLHAQNIHRAQGNPERMTAAASAFVSTLPPTPTIREVKPIAIGLIEELTHIDPTRALSSQLLAVFSACCW